MERQVHELIHISFYSEWKFSLKWMTFYFSLFFGTLNSNSPWQRKIIILYKTIPAWNQNSLFIFQQKENTNTNSRINIIKRDAPTVKHKSLRKYTNNGTPALLQSKFNTKWYPTNKNTKSNCKTNIVTKTYKQYDYQHLKIYIWKKIR